jgi:cyclopropane fatty-acyl-phospholipid synthase-like methyltransferase
MRPPMILRHTSREAQTEFMALYRRWLRRGGTVYLVDKTTLETRSADAEPVRARRQVSWIRKRGSSCA